MNARRGALGRLSPLWLALAIPAVAGCAVNSPSAPLAGWSRAPDLSVYASMDLYGEIARQQASLCGGFTPVTVRDRWARDFGSREAAVTAALAARHGAAAVERAEVDPMRRVRCGDFIDLKWRHQYARLLRLLEMRLGLA